MCKNLDFICPLGNGLYLKYFISYAISIDKYINGWLLNDKIYVRIPFENYLLLLASFYFSGVVGMLPTYVPTININRKRH